MHTREHPARSASGCSRGPAPARAIAWGVRVWLLLASTACGEGPSQGATDADASQVRDTAADLDERDTVQETLDGGRDADDPGDADLADDPGDADLADDPGDADLADDSGDADLADNIAPDTATTCAGCDDGVVCNGLETCDPTLGCLAEAFPTCPTAPPECAQDGGAGAVVNGRVSPVDGGGMRLVDADTWDDKRRLADLIAQHGSVTKVSLQTVLDDLNRVGSRVTSVPGVECFHAGFTWQSGDQDVDYWYPQGLTGTADANAAGAVAGKKVLLASWYHKPEVEGVATDKGVRIAIADVGDLDAVRYRFALLVEPYEHDGIVDLRAVTVHAGGLTWWGDLLFVPDTSRGLRVFDLTRMLRVTTGDNNLIGLKDGAYHAHGYRYVIPQVGRYTLCGGSCCARFSFLSLDRSTTPPSLLSGEYSADSRAGRLHRWALDPATGRLALTHGLARPVGTWLAGVAKVQGALAWDGRFYLSTSGANPTLWTGRPGQALVARGYPAGPEDLHYAPASDNLWSLTEHPGRRWVFAVKRARIEAGCP